MVAEKWPGHKKAIKDHKGSEFRAQCDISRKWDMCVHGARPTFDMFTRVQRGSVGWQGDRIRASLLGRLQSVGQIRLHRSEKGWRGKSQRLWLHMWPSRVTWETRLHFLRPTFCLNQRAFTHNLVVEVGRTTLLNLISKNTDNMEDQ